MKAFFLATILILGAFASEESETMEVIKRLESHAYGKQLLSTITLQLQAGDPADDLIHMLQGYEDDLQNAQDVDDAAILPLQNQCVEDLATLVAEIEATRIKIQQESDLISTLTPIKIQKEAALADAIELKGLIEAKLAELEAAKVAKDAEWAEEREQHDSQIAIVRHAQEIIVNGLAGGSFLQTKNHASVLAQVATHFNNAKRLAVKDRHMKTLFKMFASIAQNIQADQESVDHILDIFTSVLDKLAESRQIEKTDYDHFVTAYLKTKAGLTAKLNNTIALIAHLKGEIAVLNKRINIATAELHDQEERLTQKVAQHDERENFCDEAGAKYAHDREARDDQRAIISDAIGLLTAKVRLLKKYVGSATADLHKPFP